MPAAKVALPLVFSALWTVASAPAQIRLHPARGPQPAIRLDVNLVLVPVTVTDRRGATVLGLERRNFQVFEDKVPQEIVSFSSQDDACSVGLVFDVSGSMKDKLPAAKAAIREFFKSANPKDEAFLVTISTRPELDAGFSQDLDAIARSVQSARSGGRTAFMDAVYLALSCTRQARNAHKALVIVSDGMDNHSRYSRGELMALAAEADVQIYTIGLNDAPRIRKPIELQEERRGIFLLDDLAMKTGGLNFTISHPGDIPRVAAKIGRALHNQYVLGYRPAPADQGGRWRKIQVKANVPNVRVSARNGYYAPVDVSRFRAERN